MKTQKLFSFACILAVVVLASCGTSVEIAKRHFNDGYYVHIVKKNNKADVPESAAISVASPKEVVEVHSARTVEATQIVIPDAKQEITSDNELKSIPSFKSTSKKVSARVVENQNPLQETTPMIKRPADNILQQSSENDSGIPGIILIILCILVPPIAILLVDGLRTPFWVDLILWLLGGGGFTLYPAAGLLLLIAIIYAFTVCF